MPRQALCHARREIASARGDLSQRADELGRRGVLREISRRAGLQGTDRELVLRRHRQNHDWYLRALAFELLEQIEADHFRHREIEEDQIVINRPRAIEKLASIGGFIGNSHVAGRRDDLANAPSHDRMVVSHDDPDHVRPPGPRVGVSGTVSLTTVPVRLPFRTSRRPPSKTARSRMPINPSEPPLARSRSDIPRPLSATARVSAVADRLTVTVARVA